MKTLDEVIKAWSICFSDNSRSNCTGCPYADEDGEAACFNHDREDALHYLKEYKGLSKMWNDKLDKEQENPPLTWEELQQMARKPVWVEWKNPRRITRWWIVDLNEKPDPADVLIAISTSGTILEYLDKREQGDVWKAYRKERE